MEAAPPLVDGTGAAIVRALVALLLVLAAIAVTAWAARRLRSGGSGQGWFRVRAVHAVGPRERVMLVEAAGAHLLLSLSGGQLRLLHAYDEAPELPAPAAGGSFAEKLAKLRRGGAT